MTPCCAGLCQQGRGGGRGLDGVLEVAFIVRLNEKTVPLIFPVCLLFKSSTEISQQCDVGMEIFV